MNKVCIIAEAGVNHNGDINLAKKLVDVAAKAGCDYVKFQTFKAELLVSRTAKKAEYQVANTGNNDSQFDMIKALELTAENYIELKKHAESIGIKFLSTAFDLESIDFLHNLGVDFWKIPSGEITNLSYLKKIASLGMPVVFSTGMATLSDIEKTIDVLISKGLSVDDITVLQCNTEYPTPMHDVNLRAMNTIGNAFGVKVGYSDHTLGIEIPIAAVALGATVIEKHITLDKTMEGPDHLASLEPDELVAMVQGIRNVEKALGSGLKKLTNSEAKNKEIARKSLLAASDLKAGKVIDETDLIVKRPGSGISPMLMDYILGRKLKFDVEKDHIFNLSDFE